MHEHQAAPAFTNRLARAQSPYLLQHAHNPVDWFEWGDEAFTKARQEDKVVFLSVGYSTCHWCHVMERESFETEAVAKVLNDHFVCIKVDREERPDIDRVYMTFVQATTGGGGWPMNVWLTPDLKPFFGGTYFPVEDHDGRRGFLPVLGAIVEAWKTQREQVRASSADITRGLQSLVARSDSTSRPLEASLLDAGYAEIRSSHEPRYGGFGGAPKFPRPVALNFLTRHYARTGSRDALEMTLFTLRQMAGGGLHDHIGGGFHRYSVDERWHVPHFEKMLYDQAQLTCAYLDACQITQDAFHADVARDILDYVLRDLTGERGQFYSAEDADSPQPEDPARKAEGAFYVWEAAEIRQALGETTSRVFNDYYGVLPQGNVRNDPHGDFPNKNVLMVSRDLDETAKRFHLPPDTVRALLAAARQTLFELRARRPRPHLDDKTLTAWNGLMISAFARAAQVLDEPRYLEAARKSAAFLRAELYRAHTGTLLRRHRQGDSAIDGFLDDYAFLIQGLLDLYEAGFDPAHLRWAVALQERQNTLFWDATGKGYFSTTNADPNLLLRIKDDYDGAEPSPNSIAALNLLRLAEMTANPDFRARACATSSACLARLERAPSAMPQMLVALDFQLSRPRLIVIAGQADADDTRAMLRAVHRAFVPNKIVLLADGGEGQRMLAGWLQFLKGVKPLNDAATAYVCENYACQSPLTDPDRLADQLRPNHPSEEN